MSLIVSADTLQPGHGLLLNLPILDTNTRCWWEGKITLIFTPSTQALVKVGGIALEPFADAPSREDSLECPGFPASLI